MLVVECVVIECTRSHCTHSRVGGARFTSGHTYRRVYIQCFRYHSPLCQEGESRKRSSCCGQEWATGM